MIDWCIYDNLQTMCREYWIGGNLKAKCSVEVLHLPARSGYWFDGWGWEPGSWVGVPYALLEGCVNETGKITFQ